MDTLGQGFLICGAVLLVLSICFFPYKGNKRIVKGTIVRLFAPSKGDPKDVSMAHFSYIIKGEKYTSENKLCVSRVSKLGDTVIIRYDINKPEHVYAKPPVKFAILLVAAVCCLVLSFIF